MSTPEAPKTLSAAVRMALEDQKRAQQDPDLVVNMDYYHEPRQGGYCLVCFAGAVMHYRHDLSLRREAWEAMDGSSSQYHGAEWERVYRALNYVRGGAIASALSIMRLDVTQAPLMVDVPQYSERNPKPFRNAMEKIATQLEAVGL